MRTCQSCGKQNPDDQDFCSCGEYLRWEPTGYSMPAITPEQASAAAPPAEPEPAPEVSAPPVHVTPAGPVAPEPGNGQGNGHGQVVPAVAKTKVRDLPAVAPPPSVPAKPAALPPREDRRDEIPAEPATIVLRSDPQGDYAKGQVLRHEVAPGERGRVLALVRNQSGIVDNYDLRVEGLPQDWWSIYPGTVYLVPFGSGGTYEQEVEIHLHPPRGPEAEARVWECKIVADSKAARVVAAAAPLALEIGSYVETATTLRPQRRRGRRKATYDVTVANRANAPVLVALEGEDPDGELQFGFNRPPQEVPPGGTVMTQMQVRPPKQIWIGRGQDRRLEVKTVTGEEAAERAAAEPLNAAVLEAAGPQPKKRFWQRQAPRVPGVYPPRVFKPQVFPPDVNLGPGGINVRMPQFRAPQVQGPQVGSLNAGQMLKGGVKLPGRSQAAPTGPLLPTQGVFRQQPWLPWWLIPALLALAVLVVLLIKFILPHNVTVPELTGKPAGLEAQKELTKARLVLNPKADEVADDKNVGLIVDQDPPANETVAEGSVVTIKVGVGSGSVTVPKIVGLTQSDADEALRKEGLTLGAASPPDAPLTEKIASQIPKEGQPVKEGTPVNFFFPAAPKPKKDGDAPPKASDKEKDADGDGIPDKSDPEPNEAAPAGGEEILVPAIGEQDLKTYAGALGDLGLVPVPKDVFSDTPVGTPFGTEPPGGTKVKAKSEVAVLVSIGQPDVVLTDGDDILRVSGVGGKNLDPVAKTDADETNPTWNAAGTHVAFVANGQLMLKNVTKDNSTAVALRPDHENYADLAWAPTTDKNVIAMRSNPSSGEDSDLCLAQIQGGTTDVSCKAEPSFGVGLAIHWAPDGKAILGFASKMPFAEGHAGIVRWTLKPGKQPFSSKAGDWNKGKFVSDVKKPFKGVFDAAISPDGKQLALTSNVGASAYRLFIVPNTGKAADFKPKSSAATKIRACKVQWRSDSRALLLVQGAGNCGEDVASVVRVDLPGLSQHNLTASGDDPSFRPPVRGG